jgi:glycosyltransferase involved in cell wall biosynthesis
MMRQLHGVPCVGTNTIYLPAFAQHLLPNKLYENETFRRFWVGLSDSIERKFANCYNAGDGLIVQCLALANYWKGKGSLTVPLHVIPRPIDVVMFDRTLGADPYKANFPKGKRLITVGRHAREKDIDKVLKAFAQYVLPAHPEASLTLVGDGQEHKVLQQLAESLGIAHRCDFVGERPHKDLRDFYGHADLFAYASLSETYGQVISEALWCGAPVVAIDDGMGVAYQCQSGHDSFLVEPGPGEIAALGGKLVQLLSDDRLRAEFSQNAAARARTRVAPDVVYAMYEAAYQSAIDNLAAHPPKPPSSRGLGDRLRMFGNHVWPWLWQHSTLCVVGAFRGNDSYQVPRHMRIDAMPEGSSPGATTPNT